jgi:hypothetical protein
VKAIKNLWYPIPGEIDMKTWMLVLGLVGLVLTAGVMTVWITGDPRCLFMQCLLAK